MLVGALHGGQAPLVVGRGVGVGDVLLDKSLLDPLGRLLLLGSNLTRVHLGSQTDELGHHLAPALVLELAEYLLVRLVKELHPLRRPCE